MSEEDVRECNIFDCPNKGTEVVMDSDYNVYYVCKEHYDQISAIPKGEIQVINGKA